MKHPRPPDECHHKKAERRPRQTVQNTVEAPEKKARKQHPRSGNNSRIPLPASIEHTDHNHICQPKLYTRNADGHRNQCLHIAADERKRQEELDELRGERMDNSFGSQIRNYVMYPYQLVKDLRSGVETGNVDAVLDGGLDDMVLGYHKWLASQ